jgi:nitroreductase
MESLPLESLTAALKWRYATKAFDASRTIPPETWATLEESLVLTPSSFGLQPWKFLIITDPALKARLRPHCWGQSQVTDCSHLVVLCAKQEMDAVYIDKFIALTAATRSAPVEALQGYRDMIAGSVLDGGPIGAMLPEWAARQAYIALGQFMLSAAMLGIDACPMEGFVHDALNAELGLPAKGLKAAVLCPAGYRSPDDKYASAPKVRWDSSAVIEHL